MCSFISSPADQLCLHAAGFRFRGGRTAQIKTRGFRVRFRRNGRARMASGSQEEILWYIFLQYVGKNRIKHVWSCFRHVRLPHGQGQHGHPHQEDGHHQRGGYACRFGWGLWKFLPWNILLHRTCQCPYQKLVSVNYVDLCLYYFFLYIYLGWWFSMFFGSLGT